MSQTANTRTFVMVVGFILIGALIWLTRPPEAATAADINISGDTVIIGGAPVNNRHTYVPVKMIMTANQQPVGSVKVNEPFKVSIMRSIPVPADTPPLTVHLLYAVEAPAGAPSPDPGKIFDPVYPGVIQPGQSACEFKLTGKASAVVWIFGVTVNGETCFGRIVVTP